MARFRFWSLTWFYAGRTYRLIDSRLEPRFVAFLTRQYLLSDVLYLIALAAAFWNASVGLAIAVSLAFFYLLSPKEPVYREETAEQADSVFARKAEDSS